MKTFNDYLEENHLKPGTKLKKGDEELKVVKPVGDDKYLVKEEELDEASSSSKARYVHVNNLPGFGHVRSYYWFDTKDHSVLSFPTKDPSFNPNREKNPGGIVGANKSGDIRYNFTTTNRYNISTQLSKLVSAYQQMSDKKSVKEEVEIDEEYSLNEAVTVLAKRPTTQTEHSYSTSHGAHSHSHVEKSLGLKRGSISKDKPTYIKHGDVHVKVTPLGKHVMVQSARKIGKFGEDTSKHKSQQDSIHKALKKTNEEVDIDESMVARTQNGRRMVSAEAAIRLARELAAKRKEGEKATHKDLQAASAALRKEEVELDEGIASKIKSAVKKVKRATQGWGTGNAPSPKELVKRNKEYDDDGVKSMHASIHGSGIKSQKHSPGDLQKRVIDREMKRRGLTKEAVEQIDELSKETHMSYATVAGDHAVRLAKAIKVRREQGKGSSQEVKDMESERDKRVAGLSRLAKRIAEAKEEKLPKDMTGAKCEKCKKDKYKERSQFDDMDGKVTCSCGHRVDRWKKYKN